MHFIDHVDKFYEDEKMYLIAFNGLGYTAYSLTLKHETSSILSIIYGNNSPFYYIWK